MKNTNKILTVLCLLTTFFMSSCAEKSTVVELKFGHIQPESDLFHLGAVKFKEEVEAQSKGKMTVTVYPNSTLGAERDLAEGMRLGTVDFALIGDVLGNFSPSIQILAIPYLFNDQEEFSEIMSGSGFQKIADNVLEKAQIRVLTHWNRGSRQLTSNKPIKSVKDIQGLKIRVPQVPVMVSAWKEMGANPTPMAWNEVYSALEQRVIDAQENPIPFIYGARVYEVQDYLSFTDHKYEYITISMSDQRWNTLSEDQQEILVDAAKQAQLYHDELVANKSADFLKEMEASGMQVIYPDKDSFIKKVQPIHDTLGNNIDPEAYKLIKENIVIHRSK